MQEVTSAEAEAPKEQAISAAAETREQTDQETSVEELEQAKRQSPSTECSAFVRNLVFEISEDHLKKAFEKYGAIKDAFVARDPRGLSKG
jgi:RNA recognition motif-containing protein